MRGFKCDAKIFRIGCGRIWTGRAFPHSAPPHTADASLSLHRELIHNEKYSPLPLPKISYKKKKEKNFYFPT